MQILQRVVGIHLNTCLVEQLHGKLVGVALLVDNASDTGVDDHLCANNARLVCAVQGCTLQRYAKTRCLQDCVLLSMNGIAKFVTSATCNAQFFAHALALISAGLHPLWCAVVAGCQNAIVLYDDCANVTVCFVATGPLGNVVRKFHKSFVPFVHKYTLP